ncbi:uncharacterized protein ACHE_40213A [Aspergillus chevalieri]|uniref:Uncharacterized protein n=1 Tax=Aspergillus chevalieri TaxID=182096 RepID=A0A7R7ZNF9_ASPCH|nr:uncharacterized protein ACHE_40213A [Aspergillus chevalieri]BCR87649.1 hypothetical protein ACHE_40213A [Aspergillus chevalieri]
MDRWKLMKRIKKNLNDAGQMRHLYPSQYFDTLNRSTSLLACLSYTDFIVPALDVECPMTVHHMYLVPLELDMSKTGNFDSSDEHDGQSYKSNHWFPESRMYCSCNSTDNKRDNPGHVEGESSILVLD